MPYKNNAKTWFQEGDFPSETQFSQTFDWIRWKDEALAIGDITGLEDVLNDIISTRVALPLTPATTTLITVPDGYMIERIIIVPSANCIPTISYEDGDMGDIVPASEENLTPAKGGVFEISQFCVTSRNILVENVPVNSKIVYIRRKII